ncbi:penicillin acylase family protein [Daejeonella sp.]|uniref:penicillin acylase family protein n=1 Tax=Daejeonella sp. TaxID=2805397 RepID=UPI00273181F4|nr:penicillin acylase family protein [Daejeonella sp.]MDP2412837.1 penicillin acylase family protein [Daejeonella sp.]
MIRITFILIFILASGFSTGPVLNSLSESERWNRHASNTEIIRDDFGVPHIYGKTDADAVFGLLYAQCEDDFNRVEQNYIWATGRLAELDGENAIYSDLRAKLFMTQKEAEIKYQNSPQWLKNLCLAFTDGINFYLAKHPEVKPKLLTRFEPWMPMYFSEGSIGGDIEKVSTRKLGEFYGRPDASMIPKIMTGSILLKDNEPRGSNGFAVSGKLTESGNAMLLINPHTSFFFRGEVHVQSEQGLNAYGAVTWGQFFIYQGFNEKTGWMHTTSDADIIDEFEETIYRNKNGITYKYGNELRPVDSLEVVLKYKKGDNTSSKKFMVYRTHHGPVTHASGNKWLSTAMMWDPVKALQQSFLRTKNSNQKQFDKMMNIRTNSSNNTVYADADGNIAYYHGNFIPKRDTNFDYKKPVDGTNPKTDWKGLHDLKDNIFLLNPASGWIQNCNSTPFTSAGASSPKPENYPGYMSYSPENYRGVHAISLLSKAKNLTIDKMIELAYDPYLPGAEELIRGLIQAYDNQPVNNEEMKTAINLLKNWDFKVSSESKAMTISQFYLNSYINSGKIPAGTHLMEKVNYMSSKSPAKERLEIFANSLADLKRDFGSVETAWGEFNRYQRINGDINQNFNDALPSIPIGMASGEWGALASFGTRKGSGTKRQYGVAGNSFVAVVEFGEKVKAKSMLAGGQNADPKSVHFDDQMQRYADRKFKTVAFYREDVLKRAESRYHPGDKK